MHRNFPLHRSFFAFVCAVALSTLVLQWSPALAAAPSPALELRVVPNDAGDTWSVWADSRDEAGRERSTLLRWSTREPVPGLAWTGPKGRALFADWEEAGTRWSAFSRDGGASWSEARATGTALLLRAGAVEAGEPMPFVPPALAGSPSDELWIAQFRGPGQPEWRAALEQQGARVLKFFPRNAHVVRATEDVAGRLAALPFVERVELYHPAYRLEGELQEWSRAATGEEPRRVRVVAFEWGSAAKSRIAAAAQGLGATVAEPSASGHVIELWVGPTQLQEIARHPDVMWIDSWSPRETDMDLVREDSGANWLESLDGYCGAGVRGEVMDQGVEEDHQDFDGILLHTASSVASHGTSTYGIVFGNGNRDGDGDEKATGLAPCAEQGIFADYDSYSDRFEHTEELKQAPYFASFQTNSWGNARTLSYNSYSQEMDDIIWRLDIAILQSQSNAGDQASRPQAWAKNIISVGGIRHKDTLDTSDDEWDSGASIGPAEDGRIKPDIHYWYDSIYTTTTGNGYTSSFGGTSAATPESAGVVALMVGMWANNVWGTDPEGDTVFEKQPHASTIKALAINNAQQYDFSGTGDDLTRVHQGWGRPSARLAQERAASSFIVDEEVSLMLGETVTYDVEVEAGTDELKITMVYPDPPGTTSATLHRINDLDLEVVSPGGTTYHGNHGLDAAPYSTPGGSPNALDTVENVFVEAPEEGLWTVEIRAAEINEDADLDTPAIDATFALVVTGGSAQTCEPPVADFTITPNPASIGQSVTFDSTVSGGAGGPYTYAWDFDGDEVVDSTEADPVYVYHRPYEGPVTLAVRDVESCPAEVENPITVTGADARYDGYEGLVEIEGNGNGKIDPGEIWDVAVRLRNDGTEDAQGVTARVAPNPLTPGPVAVLVSELSFGTIPVGQVVTGTPPLRFQVGQLFPCGEEILFDVLEIRSTVPENRYPDEIAVIDLLCGGAGPSVVFHEDGFEVDAGWSSQGGGEWQQDAPRGLGLSNTVQGVQIFPDPTSAYAGDAVLGTDLTGVGSRSGDYEGNISSTITSGAIDASNSVETRLEFVRWLNVIPEDRAFVQVSRDGETWRTLFDATEGSFEGTWISQEFDVSEEADRNPEFRIRFGIESNETAECSGWNVDELVLRGVTKDSCSPVTRAVPGATSGLTILTEGAGDLTLSWEADCGAGSLYGVYRGDLTRGYASLAPVTDGCDLSGTSVTIPAGEAPAEFFLVVPSDGAFEGSYGVTSTSERREPAFEACHPRDQVDGCAP